MRGALLVLLLLVPFAAADHVFSHRVYVVGRVVDSEGVPAPGLAVNVTFVGFAPGGPCFDSRTELTGPQGDYEVCRHVHTIPSDAAATIRVGALERTVGIDPDLRHASASFQLDGPTEVHDVNGERLFARTLLATGRAFVLLPDAENAEGVAVNATPLVENVTIRLRVGDDVLAEKNATPNEHGLFRVELAVETIPEGALLRATAAGAGSEETVSSLFRRVDLNVIQDLRLIHGPGGDAPGSAPAPLPAWVGMLSIAFAWALVARLKA